MHMEIVQIRGRTLHVHQFECNVVMYSELDSKSDFRILNWGGLHFVVRVSWALQHPLNVSHVLLDLLVDS
jgi:hypothetical protein